MNQALRVSNNLSNSELLEKVIINNDFSGLTSIEKVRHIKNMCESLGLNPLTKPIQLIRFKGKEIPYFTKDSTEQLRKNHGVSIKIRESTIINGIYVVTADARLPDGREDSSTGATSIEDLKGDDLCNAMLKAETKAKRRVTLSICGLGFIDESEIETIKGAKKVDFSNQNDSEIKVLESGSDLLLEQNILDISQCKSMEQLQDVYTKAYKHWISWKDKEALEKIIKAKDEQKKVIEEVKELLEGEIENAE